MNLPFTSEYLAWKEYERLEREFLEICEYVELDGQHHNVYSYKFLNLMVAIGVEFDSVSRALIAKCLSQGIFKDETLASKLRDKQSSGNLNMGDYREAFEHLFKASERAVSVNRLGVWFEPFKPHPSQAETSLPWWKAFTSLKHDRIQNFIQFATMTNVLDGLAALLLVNLFFRREGDKIVCPGLELSKLFSVNFLKVTRRTMGVSETAYTLQE